MDFTEEKTPAGYVLKVLLKKNRFLVFNSRGESFAADSDGRSLLHKIPNIVFLGNIFLFERDYFNEFSLLKVRDNTLILPYRNIIEKKRKYLFIHYVTELDLIPVNVSVIKSYSIMLKELPSDTEIDYLIIDESISEIEASVITSRYKPYEIIKTASDKKGQSTESAEEKSSGFININTMSDNPVFLASYHLKNMALSNLNQLLLDFDISAFDTQFIIHFIEDILEKRGGEKDVVKNRQMLLDLKSSFEFYLALIVRDESILKEKIDSETDLKKISPYRTLVSKVRSMNPGREEQLLYTEFENMVLEREEILKSG